MWGTTSVLVAVVLVGLSLIQSLGAGRRKDALVTSTVLDALVLAWVLPRDGRHSPSLGSTTALTL